MLAEILNSQDNFKYTVYDFTLTSPNYKLNLYGWDVALPAALYIKGRTRDEFLHLLPPRVN